MYQLYSIPGSCSSGIHVLLNQLQQPVDIIKREDVDQYTDLVPTNQVPALQDGNVLLTEGASIVLHLLKKHGPDGDAMDSEFRQWLMFNYATLHPSYSKLFTVADAMPEGNQKHALMQVLAKRVVELWAIVDARLSDRDCMYGSSLTIIDYLLALYVRWGNVFPSLNIPVGENVLRLVNCVAEQPEFNTALVREGVEYRIPNNAYSRQH